MCVCVFVLSEMGFLRTDTRLIRIITICTLLLLARLIPILNSFLFSFLNSSLCLSLFHHFSFTFLYFPLCFCFFLYLLPYLHFLLWLFLISYFLLCFLISFLCLALFPVSLTLNLSKFPHIFLLSFLASYSPLLVFLPSSVPLFFCLLVSFLPSSLPPSTR